MAIEQRSRTVAIDILFPFEHAVFTTKKSAKSYVQLFTQRILSASPNDAGFIIPPLYQCRDQSGRSGLSQSSGFPVVMAFQSFQLSGRSRCLVMNIFHNLSPKNFLCKDDISKGLCYLPATVLKIADLTCQGTLFKCYCQHGPIRKFAFHKYLLDSLVSSNFWRIQISREGTIRPDWIGLRVIIWNRFLGSLKVKKFELC